MKRRDLIAVLGISGATGAISGCGGGSLAARQIDIESPVSDGLTADWARTGRRHVHDVGSHRSPWGANGMVATANPNATRVGLEVLRRQGNAIDAAVATAITLGVAEPYMSGVGGWGGYMMFYSAQKQQVLALDMMGRSPSSGLPRTADEKRAGCRSAIVPGNLAGWAEMLRSYGSMSLGDLIEPALALATDGFVLSPYDALKFGSNFEKLNRFGDSRRVFMPHGHAPATGEVIRQPDLARTLSIIARDGPGAFYDGALGAEFIDFLNRNGGLLNAKDLRDHRPRWRSPTRTMFQNHEIHTMGRGSGALATIQILNIMDELSLSSMDPYSVEFANYWVEACRLALIDDYALNTARSDREVPVDRLISKQYAREQLRTIQSLGSLPRRAPPMAMNGTTHLVTADRLGNVVSYTTSLGAEFGSGVVVGNTGIVLNNGMDLGFSDQTGHINEMAPGQVAMGRMNPVIATMDDEPVLAVGAAGGFTIPQTIALVIAKVLGYGMDVQQAIAAPRVVLNARQLPDARGNPPWLESAWLYFDPTYPADVRAAIMQRGFMSAPANAHAGGVQAVFLDRKNRTMAGGSDPRRNGLALGY
jgi:gamma-glutamyltranspeptidase/glutathione hydrolase